MKILIAYYSRAGENYFGGSIREIKVGNTEKVALAIKNMVGGDIFKIEEVEPYPCEYRAATIQARNDLKNNKRPKLKDNIDISSYDVVYLGYPNYWGTMPVAVYSFLESHDFTGKTIYPFCTHEGSGLSNTVNDIKKTVPASIVNPGYEIQGSHVDECGATLAGWINNR